MATPAAAVEDLSTAKREEELGERLRKLRA